jgi:nucleotide-binding universal stress UspA family protein
MTKGNPILVAFDGTERADNVLDEAVEIARRCGSKLILLRTTTVAPVFAPAAMLAAASQVTSSEEAAQRDLRARAERVPAGLLQAAIVRLGPTWEAIAHIANETGAHLIVIGCARNGRFGRRSDAVVDHAPCPVVVVPERIAS